MLWSRPGRERAIDSLFFCGGHAEIKRSAKPADNRSQWHEREKHEHPAVTFKVADIEDIGVSEAKTNAERSAQ